MSSASTGSLKRTSADAGLPEKPIRTNKRRAPKACRCCRARKVRCNVMEYGAPCTNCRLDEVECVIAEGKRKSRKSFAKAENPARDASSPSDNGHEDLSGSLPDLRPLSAYNNELSQFGAHVPHSIYQSHHTSGAKLDHHNPGPDSISTSRLAGLPGANPAYSSSIFRISKCLSQLPSYLKPLPAHLGFDENSYLAAKGALALPEHEVVEQLIRAFARWHYPLMPVVDIDFILRAIVQDNQTAKISLLLLYAIIYAGSAHVDLAWLRKAGYADRRTARAAFYRRTRLLYDFDCEPDRFTQVQTLILMTSYYSSDGKEGCHWLGTAIYTATSLGLNRDPSKTHLSIGQQRLCKRVWWSLVIRDRLMALGHRRPTSIKMHESDVPMLTLDDYEPAQPPISFTNQEDHRPAASIHIELAKLSLCIGQVLTTQYSVNPKTNFLNTDTRGSTLTPRTADSSALTCVNSCHHELEEWQSNLSPDAHRPIEAELDPNFSTNLSTTTLLNRALLHLIYYTTLSTLHRPQMLPGSSSPADFSRHQVYSAAVAITSLTRLLLAKDLVGHVPTFGTTVLLPAMTKHLVDLRECIGAAANPDPHIEQDDEARKQSLQGFAYCVRAMRKLQEQHAGADFSMTLVEKAVQRANIRLTPGPVDRDGNAVYFATGVEDLMQMACSENLLPAQQPLTTPPDEVEVGHLIMPSQSHLLHEPIDTTKSGSSMMLDGTAVNTIPSLHSMNPSDLLKAAATGPQAHHIDTFLASTPPLSDHDPLSAVPDMSNMSHMDMDTMGIDVGLLHNASDANIEYELQAFLNLDVANEFALEFDTGHDFVFEHAHEHDHKHEQVEHVEYIEHVGFDGAMEPREAQVEEFADDDDDEKHMTLGDDAIAMPHD